MTATAVKRQPNMLLSALVGLSLVIHFFVFLHISGIYRSQSLQYIELALTGTDKPSTRAIPRPKPRPKIPDQPRDVQRVVTKVRPVPRMKPIQMAPVTQRFSNDLMAGINVPGVAQETIHTEGVYSLAEALDTGAQYTSSTGYLEMVLLKIEGKKKYPATARSTGKEGRIPVAFTITLTGDVRDVRVLKPCRFEVLNQAAVEAVRTAAPFPRPPGQFFKKPVSLKINIVFELT